MNHTTNGTTLHDAIRADTTGIPFRTELSLEPLVKFWTGPATEDCATMGIVAGLINEKLEKAPELGGRIDDLAAVDRHEGLVDLLMSAVFAPASWEQEYGAALVPFQLRPFYATPLCERVLLGADGYLRGTVSADAQTVNRFRRLKAYALVLDRVYGVDLGLDYTIILTVRDEGTGLDRHFNVRLDGRFIDVVPVGPIPELSDDVRRDLAAGLVPLETLATLLPSDRFVLRGFTVFRAVDVTREEVLSSLKRDLIDKESIVSTTRFAALQAKLQTFFSRPELRLGLAAVEGDQVFVLNYGAHMDHACIFADSKHHKTSEFAGTIYERAVKQARTQFIHDLTTEPGRTCIEDQLVDAGIRNFVVAPLHYQGRIIGTLELGSPKPGDLNASHLPKLDEVLPLFAVAVQRSMEELNARIQAFIKEKCTAIHPTVEWRFRRAVLDTMERHTGSGLDGPMDMDAIVFEHVYPLYGLADIRGSSTQRALAIQADLVAQLRLARAVVDTAYGARALPALGELRYRIDRHLGLIGRGLKTGDEVGVTAFLRTDVEPLFDHVGSFDGGVRDRIEAYRSALDPRLGAVYEERRRFEQSVTRIAETISSYLELEEQTAQSMAPHYFEKQKTDGVDYQIYAGDSLLDGGCVDPLCLRNLRLWQLMVTCGIALRAHRLRDELPLPLETTHLVLVQHAPLAIRFRFDEKRFDVDGAYDIRYEIVKKRIDKAAIRGTTERVTQPGKIAIVYGQAAEAHEYRGYVEYLQSLGYVTRDVEDVELEELQGVHGLRALRLTVDLSNPRSARPVAAADLQSTR